MKKNNFIVMLLDAELKKPVYIFDLSHTYIHAVIPYITDISHD